MKLSHTYINSQFFQFLDLETFAACCELNSEQIEELRRLASLGLPPIINKETLAILLGFHRGLIWSILRRPEKYYRTFQINTGTKRRTIYAPRIALKVIQKWLGVQYEKIYERPEHVYGFIQGQSHLHAAKTHLNARWIVSVDLKDFFAATSRNRVNWALKRIGYTRESAKLITDLVCFNGGLAQGSPASPVLSNLCAYKLDRRISAIAKKFNCRVSRYADDITFSGVEQFPDTLLAEIKNAARRERWELADHKTNIATLPHRLKVHGLLVEGEKLRLTKGYRNKIRAFKHVMQTKKVSDEDMRRIQGHLHYAASIEQFNQNNLERD